MSEWVWRKRCGERRSEKRGQQTGNKKPRKKRGFQMPSARPAVAGSVVYARNARWPPQGATENIGPDGPPRLVAAAALPTRGGGRVGRAGQEGMWKIYRHGGWIGFLFSGETERITEACSVKMSFPCTRFFFAMSPRERPSKTLDAQDRKILRALQQNARLSNAELAEQVGMSTTACWNRTRQLEADGYIEGYVALVNQQKLGYADIVILEVTLDRHEDDALARFGAELAALPEVLEAYLVSGEYDYWIKVAVDGTAGYERFLREKLYRISSIRHSRSMFALRCMKDVPSMQV
jgi:Lrp/AsnC family transcriptional regulator, leucine-responsive regulatory protein